MMVETLENKEKNKTLVVIKKLYLQMKNTSRVFLAHNSHKYN